MVRDSAVVLDIQCRDGSRVVQMISRNHSNVSKPAFVISQVLYCVQEIRYPSCFIVKKRKKASQLVIPSITQQTQPFPSEFRESPFARIRPLSILPRTTPKNSLARPEKVCTQWVGLDGVWILSQITQNPLQLARNTHIVLRTTQSRLWLAI